ncbi:hypothetical protein FQN49_004844, partial [Arthroderma sp. PD_2]
MHLYAFGSNGAGQLAIGHMEDVNRPTRCLFVGDEHASAVAQPSASGDGDSQRPMRLVAGGNHTLIRLPSGIVYAAGSNVHGECGTCTTNQNLLRFQRVVITEPIAGTHDNAISSTFSYISATWSASFFVNADGKSIYVVGHGSKGELGLGPDVTETKVPARMPNFPPDDTHVVSIASGMGHTVVLLDDGTVYGWGGARKGQLGADKVGEKVVWSPQRMMVGGDSMHDQVRGISCGREFTVITTSSSSSPSDASAKALCILGPDKWTISSAAPPIVAGHTSLATSWHGVYVHLRNGKVLAWGRNDR